MLTLFVLRDLIRKSIYNYYQLLMIIAGGCVALHAFPANSSQSLYSLSINQDVIQSAPGLNQAERLIGTVHIENTTISNLSEGDVVEIAMPGSKVVNGKVITLNSPPVSTHSAALGSTSRKIISLDNNAGAVELILFNNSVTKMLLHDVVDEKIYLANINPAGDGQLHVQDNNDYYCVTYPQTDTSPAITQQSPVVADLIPDIASLRTLQSRPGSANVLYLDYWGGTLTDSAWNANYTSNAPINYTAFDSNGNPGAFSSAERYSIWLSWREVVEDFAPFDINITTNPSIYAAAAVTNRSKIIITTSKSWYPNAAAGGVAYIGIFGYNSDYYKVGWAWNSRNSNMGVTIAHEAGHQLGLYHDGTQTYGYYFGHGSWGPIMGAAFGREYAQWSKGEYPGANEFEDDIAIITAKLGSVTDDAGNGLARATMLDLPVSNKKGLIGPGDLDSYKFTLSATGSVQIKVIPLMGDEGESRAANLAMNVSLLKLNPSGGVESFISKINASDITPLSPLTNKFDYNGDLGPGTYALQIEPNSPDMNWATGFGNYGNAGEYRLSISATNQPIRTLGRPVIDPASDIGLFIWESAKNKWVANIVSGDKQREVGFDVVSEQAISNVVPISIETDDVLTQFAESLDMRFNVKAPWMDGVKFTIINQSNTCVSIANADVPIYLGPDRVPMPATFDLNTLGECDPSSIKTIGRPLIDPSSDVGLFIWENARNKWAANVVSGDKQRVVKFDVESDQVISNVVLINIESNDVFTLLPKGLDLQLNINPPWLDGFKFNEKPHSNTCVKTLASNFPIYIGPNRIKMGNTVNLSTLAGC